MGGFGGLVFAGSDDVVADSVGGGASRADHVSMRVKTSALYMSGYLDGILKFWARMHDGQWLAGVTLRVTDAGGTNLVEIDMLVTADAIAEVPATT